MPKEKFSLSKKHEYLIDKLGEIPDPEELSHRLFSADTLQGNCSDHRGNTEEILLYIIETLTKGTQQEETGREIVQKARTVFDYFDEKESR